MKQGGKRPGAGRPKGSKAPHTIQAEKAKARLIEMFIEEQEPVFEALIKSAKEGYTPAIKELFERVWGKVPSVLETDPDGEIKLPFVISIKQQNGQS
jgi:hypothetical protein